MPTCRLCEQEREVCDSHVIPEFCYRPLYDEKHRAIEAKLQPKMREQFLQKGYREPLLCSDCEQFLNTEYEQYFKRAWYDEGRCPDRVATDFVPIEGLDYARFKLFHLSVLWRASVAKRVEFGAVQLGVREQHVRQMLRNRDPGPVDRYLVLGLILEMDGQVVHEAIMPSGMHRTEEGHRVYVMAFAGCLWAYLVANHDASGYERFALNRSGAIVLARRDFRKLKYLKPFLRKFASPGRFEAPSLPISS